MTGMNDWLIQQGIANPQMGLMLGLLLGLLLAVVSAWVASRRSGQAELEPPSAETGCPGRPS